MWDTEGLQHRAQRLKELTKEFEAYADKIRDGLDAFEQLITEIGPPFAGALVKIGPDKYGAWYVGWDRLPNPHGGPKLLVAREVGYGDDGDDALVTTLDTRKWPDGDAYDCEVGPLRPLSNAPFRVRKVVYDYREFIFMRLTELVEQSLREVGGE